MKDEGRLFQDWQIALANLEQQANALFSLQNRLDNSERAGAHDPMLRMGFGSLRSVDTSLSRLPPVIETADWARTSRGAAERAALRAYPGHGSALLQTMPHATIGYILEGNDAVGIGRLVGSVYLAQRDKESFAPVFVTFCDLFDPFIANNYIFEFLPPRSRFDSDPERYEAWRSERLAHIKAKWGITDFITIDTEASHRGHGGQSGRPRVVVFPDYGRSNPYLEMMYSKLVDGFEIEFAGPSRAVELLQSSSVIFHLHWEDAVARTLRANEIPSAMASFIASIDELKANGGLFLWTIHNLDPHDATERELDIEFSRQLYLRADCIHTHDQRTAMLLRARFGAEKEIITIEHPSYEGYCPGRYDRILARQSLGLGLGEQDEVFLWFGQVRRYKGIETLLNVTPDFEGRATFILAGRSGVYDPRSAVPNNCIVVDGHIDNERLAALFSAADFFVLPFEEITTSGSMMLAMTYALPVITPGHDVTRCVVRDGREGFLYPPEAGAQGLSLAIARALETPKWQRGAMELSAMALAASRNPDAFASAIRRLFDDMLSAKKDKAHAPARKSIAG